MPSEKVKERISATIKKHQGPGNAKGKDWIQSPAIVKRVQTTFLLYEKGWTLADIAHEMGVSWSTSQKDIQRARDVEVLALAETIEEKRADSVSKRRRIQSTAYAASEKSEPEQRAPLLRVITDNQTGIEELHGLRAKDKEPPPPTIIMIQVGDGPPKHVEELSDEKLIELTGETVEGEFTEVPDAED